MSIPGFQNPPQAAFKIDPEMEPNLDPQNRVLAFSAIKRAPIFRPEMHPLQNPICKKKLTFCLCHLRKKTSIWILKGPQIDPQLEPPRNHHDACPTFWASQKRAQNGMVLDHKLCPHSPPVGPHLKFLQIIVGVFANNCRYLCKRFGQ